MRCLLEEQDESLLIERTGAFWTRRRARDAVLVLFTLAALAGCLVLAGPFFDLLMWALALAVMTAPLAGRLERRGFSRGMAALIIVLMMVVILVGPGTVLIQQLVQEARQALPELQQRILSQEFREGLTRIPFVRSAQEWVEGRLDIAKQLQSMAGSVASVLPAALGSSAWILTQVVLMLVALFYFVRDRVSFMAFLRGFMPMSSGETEQLFGAISKAISAALYGNVVVKLVQGLLTGVMMGILGVPLPVLGGAAAALFALLPMLGTAIVWIPAALWLLMQGSWIKAIILLVWGGAVVSMADNFLYPYLVAGELRLHPLAILFSVFGGMLIFGFVGMVVGPLILAITVSLLGVWRDRGQHRESHIVQERNL